VEAMTVVHAIVVRRIATSMTSADDVT
jgi:hypothetical protein